MWLFWRTIYLVVIADIMGQLKILLAVDLSSIAIATYYTTGNEDTFASMVNRTANAVKATHIIFAADTPGGSDRRRQILAEYKADRSDALDRDLYVTNIATKLMSEGRVVVGGDYEADDYLNSIVNHARPVFDHTYVFTNDRDMWALITGSASVVMRRHGQSVIMGELDVFREIGVYPEQYPFWKALVGDPSDNLGGVRGIGDKIATTLVKKYGNLDNLYASLDSVRARDRKLLEIGKELAYKTYQVVSLQSPPMPFEFTVRDMQYHGSL